MKNAKSLSFLIAVSLVLSFFAGCAANTAAPESAAVPVAAAPASTEAATSAATAAPASVGQGGYEEGTSDTDNIVNTTAADKVLLVVSFGTSFNESRNLTIGGIETALQAAYPEYQVRRAFTSQIIIDKLAARDNLRIDNIEQAMDRLLLDGVKEVVVQPTTVMSGLEYDDVIEAVTQYGGKFESLKVGKPLLIDDSDYDVVADALTEETAAFRADGTAIVFMGHGTSHDANATYTTLQALLTAKGYDDCLIGTVEAAPTLEDVRASLKTIGAKKVILRPLMIVAGDHANNDMASDEADSWKTVLTGDGYEVESVIEGLGQVKSIQDLFVRHVEAAIASEEVADAPEEESTDALTADQIKNGTYAIEVDSSVSMFKIIDCQLTVEDGAMSAVITLSGQGFGKLYFGKAADAATDTANQYDFFLNGETHAFTVPVPVLNEELDCAGYSIRKDQWYDHTVTFQSGAIPADAFVDASDASDAPATSVAESTGDSADARTISVTLTGGSGKATVDSPAKLITKDGADCAEVVWSSPNYSYMIVGGVKYLPVNPDGNSTFEIPVMMDTDMAVIACTTAMSTPKEVEYTLRFDSSSIQ